MKYLAFVFRYSTLSYLSVKATSAAYFMGEHWQI